MMVLDHQRLVIGTRSKWAMKVPLVWNLYRLRLIFSESRYPIVDRPTDGPKPTLGSPVSGSIRLLRLHLPQGLVFALAALLQSQLCLSQAQQLVLDTVSEQTEIIDLYGQGVTSTEDGGTIVHLTTDQGDVQWKLDQTGVPIWCKRYGISSQHRARMPDGGVVFCDIAGHDLDGDTTHVHVQVVRTDALGGVIWSKLLTIHDQYNNFFVSQRLYLATDETGGCAITMSAIGGSVNQWFYCFDADGELLWSRNFLLNVNADQVQHLCSDGFGGWYFGSYDWGASVFRMGRLNFLGEVTWYNSYAVTGPEFWLGGICSSEFEAIAVGGYDAVSDDGDYRWFVMRLDLNGNLDWLRVSATTEPMLSQCSATEAGEILVSGGQNGYQSYMARLSNGGNVISSFRADTVAVAGTSITTWLSEWALLDTTLTFGNYLRSQTDGGSPASYQPAIWRLPISDLDACGTEENVLTSVLASNSAVAVQDQPYSEVVVPVTVTDTVCSVTSFTPISVSDYCYYFTGIPPVEQVSSTGRVLTTLLVPGEPITVMGPVARCGITVHDAHGRLLYQGLLAAHGNGSIPTSSWSPGLYFVRFQPENGGKPNVVKVVIE